MRLPCRALLVSSSPPPQDTRHVCTNHRNATSRARGGGALRPGLPVVSIRRSGSVFRHRVANCDECWRWRCRPFFWRVSLLCNSAGLPSEGS